MPAGLYYTLFGDPGNYTRDGRNFLEAVWSRPVGADGGLRWRFSYEQFRYRGRYDYAQSDAPVLDQRDEALGDWLGTQLYYRRPLKGLGDLTVGGEANADLRNLQQNYLVAPAFEQQLRVSARDASYALFAQQEWPLRPHWTLYGGLRLDDSRLHRRYASPRAALVWKPSPTRALKFIYGRAFRNPSAYEMFYSTADGYYLGNPSLGPERMQTLETAWEQKLAGGLELVATGYRYRLRDLIGDTELPAGGLQFRNLAQARATGFELEIRGRPWDRWETAAAVALQRARASGDAGRPVNSPRAVAQGRAAVPLFAQRLTVAAALRYLSSRLDRAGGALAGVALLDLTASTHRLHRDFDLSFGVRNLLDARYADPLSPEHPALRMPRAGRTMFLKLVWRQGG